MNFKISNSKILIFKTKLTRDKMILGSFKVSITRIIPSILN